MAQKQLPQANIESLSTSLTVYLTIIPRARVGYEMIDIITSYLTSGSGIIVLLKAPQIIDKSFLLYFVKTTKLMRTVTDI